MSVLKIYMKSGNVLELKVSEWSLKKNTFTNEINSISYTLKKGKLAYISLEEIEAVLED